ncbi:MAG: tRNA dihydrouridine synthase DusB [Desulfobulbus sp.]|nr:tRNA dihydrouridine synthase DusB [Desulfobulbus sp.]
MHPLSLPGFPPLTVGPLRLASSLILAPLAGHTDLPFRLLCRESGAALCVSEMISCHGLVFEQGKTHDLLRTVPQERPFAVQLFGGDPEIMARAAAIVTSLPVDLIDINMGCPVRKVVKKGYGAALMKDPHRAEAIIRAVCARTSLPVTVKFRSGWSDEHIIAPEFAAMAEEAGAAAAVIHGRTWAQGFGGKADWGVIREVKNAVSIPVIGNGDVLTRADGRAMMAATGCDGVMVGRGALGNPWLFGPDDRPVSLAGRMPVIMRYLQLAQQFLPLPKVLFKVKNQTAKLLTGLSGAASMRQALYGCDSIEAIAAVLHDQHAGEER